LIPVYVLGGRLDRLFFFIPRFARLLSDSGYAKSANHEGFKMPEGQDKGYKKIKNLAQSCQGIYFFVARFARLLHYLSIYQHLKFYPACQALQMLGIIA
jgi:hypothetical protein